MSISNDITKLLSGSIADRLEVIETRTRQRLASILGVSQDDMPESLEYIVFEVTQKRFNRIGQEGMSSFSQEGLSMSFADSDFDEYANEIDDWRKTQEDAVDKRRGRFRLY